MVCAKCLLKNSEGTRKKWLGPFKLVLRLVQLRQACEAASHMRVRRPQPLFSNLQGSQEEWFCLLVLPLTLIKHRQIVQTESGIKVLRSIDLFPNAQSTQVQRLRFHIIVPQFENLRQV